MILFFEILIFVYCSLMLVMFITNLLNRDSVQREIPHKSISIIIPFKNESKNLQALLESIMRLDYSIFEVVFINDHSEDDGVQIIENFISNTDLKHIQVINQEKGGSGKKDAIEKGVSLSKYNYCVQTDADCNLPRNWLLGYNLSFELNDFVIGNVLGENKKGSLLNAFQEIEFFMLSGIKNASIYLGFPLLASGANLGYKKDCFLKCNPFKDNKRIASGDDMFILQKFKENKFIIGALGTDYKVTTSLQTSWKMVINQRTRWARKTPKLKNTYLNIFGFITIIANFTALASLLLYLVLGTDMFLLIVVFKFLVDFLLLFLLVLLQNRLKLLIYSPIMILAYPLVLMILIGNSLYYNNKW